MPKRNIVNVLCLHGLDHLIMTCRAKLHCEHRSRVLQMMCDLFILATGSSLSAVGRICWKCIAVTWIFAVLVASTVNSSRCPRQLPRCSFDLFKICHACSRRDSEWSVKTMSQCRKGSTHCYSPSL